MTTPWDDPQAELSWMFLQNLSAEGDIDDGFALLSEDFTYWSNATGRIHDKIELRQFLQHLKGMFALEFELLSCLRQGEDVVIEAKPDGVTATGVHYNSPIVFLFRTRDGLITSIREYGDTRLVAEAFGSLTDRR